MSRAAHRCFLGIIRDFIVIRFVGQKKHYFNAAFFGCRQGKIVETAEIVARYRARFVNYKIVGGIKRDRREGK